MAEKIVSPGVFTNEIDQSFLPAAIGEIGAAIIGPTVKGPALVPTVVTSYQDFQRKFGDSFKSGSSYYQYLTSHTAEQYLRHTDKLTVVRILAGDFSHATTTISSSIDPVLVGGGTKATASLTVNGIGAVSASNNEFSCSIGDVTFTLTGSGWSPSAHANTATSVFVVAGASTAATATEFRNVVNNSGSLHGLTKTISASVASSTLILTANSPGAFGLNGEIFGGSKSGSGFSSLNSGYGTKAFATSSVSMSGHLFQDGEDFNSATFKNVFKLHTLADGEIMNSVGPEGSANILESGSAHNLRYEISGLNVEKGSFTLAIRRGDDVVNRKQTLETYTNVNLDPNTPNYIGKAIGDQKQTIRFDENGKPFLQMSGSYPNKSKYVRVEVLTSTPDYIDENGEIRLGEQSASLPHFSGSAFSGSEGGSFSGGSDGTVTNPPRFYETIEENNSQGLDPSTNGGSAGYDQYIQALDLLSNQDEYDVNLILTPGIIDSIHSGITSKVIKVCEDRGDCFAIIDPVEIGKNVADAVTRAEARNSSYAAMYWPWVKIPDTMVAGKQRWVPPSVSVASVYSFTDKVAHPWFAPAGLNRGTLDTVIQAERKLTKSDRDTLYDSSINPLATFPGQGVTIFGQKTLQKKASALDRVNVRRLLIKLKKFIASSSRFLVFEQNTAATRRRFLGIVNPYLNQVQAQSGVSAFRVVMDETNNTADTIDRNQLVGQIFVQPTRTAEFIVLDFTIQRTGAAFPE